MYKDANQASGAIKAHTIEYTSVALEAAATPSRLGRTFVVIRIAYIARQPLTRVFVATASPARTMSTAISRQCQEKQEK